MNSDAMERYRLYLQYQSISVNTRRNYFQRVKGFLHWLQGSPEGPPALKDPMALNLQLRDYKAFLLARGASASTINGVLSAVDNFSISRGMEIRSVRRIDLAPLKYEALDDQEEKRLIKSLVRSSLRNRILVLLLWQCGLRICEAASLTIADLNLNSDVCDIRIRCAKKGKARILPISSQLRHCLQQYISQQLLRSNTEPLFVSQKGSRLSVASIDRIVRQIGQSANIALSAGRLRYDFVNRLIRSEIDIVMIAELCGHTKLESVRRYFN